MNRTDLKALVATVLATLIVGGPAFAQADEKPAPKPPAEKKDAEKKDEEKKPLLELPDGSLTDQLDYLTEQFAKGPKVRTLPGIREFLSELAPLSDDVTTKLLATEDNDVAVLQAIEMHMRVLAFSKRYGVNKTNKEIDAFVATLKKDKRPTIVKFVNFQELSTKVDGVRTASPKEQVEIADAVVKHVSEAEQIAIPEVQIASNAVRAFGYSGDYELAARTADALGKVISKADDKRFARAGRYMVGAGRRFRLPGNQMKLEGKTHDGKDFDWSSYRGKVVLVDFWATWCGPCIRELPNVQANYEKYHGKGFEVVGISIDNDLSKLESFLDRRKLPWVNLHSSEDDDPNAAYYGVNSIPNTMLVGRDGKVLELNVRGPKLGQLLEKHLGPVENTETTGEESGE